MFCPNCGAQVADQAAVCVHCGNNLPKKAGRDSAGAGWWWLGFLIPMAGFLIWIFCHDSTPRRAKKAGMGALVGTILSVVLSILFIVVYILFMIFIIQESVVGSYLLFAPF